MAGTARFLILPTGDYSTDVNGSDEVPSPSGPTIYQMVPLDDSRPGHFEYSGVNCVISFTKAGIAELWDEKNANPLPKNQIVLNGSNSGSVRFTVRGKAEGRTTLVATDVKGDSLSHIIVSVKTPLRLGYRLYSLTDKHRTDTKKVLEFLSGQVIPLFTKVMKQQANIDLFSNGPSAEIGFSNEYLGNPLLLNSPRYPFWHWSKNWWWHILNKAITEHNSEATRLNIIGAAFNFEYDANLGGFGYPIGGNTGIGGKYSLIELTSFGQYQILSTVHEAGHALTLDHNLQPKADPHYCMLPHTATGYRFNMREIDTLNPSASSFSP